MVVSKSPEKKKLTGKKFQCFLFNDYFLLCSSDFKKGVQSSKKIKIESEDAKVGVEYEIVESGPRSVMDEIHTPNLKKKEFLVKWKNEEWMFEVPQPKNKDIATDDELKSWVAAFNSKVYVAILKPPTDKQ